MGEIMEEGGGGGVGGLRVHFLIVRLMDVPVP